MATSLDDLVNDIFLNEGDVYGDQTTRPPIDQPTGRGGITLDTLTAYFGRPATVETLKALTHEQAAQVVRWEVQQIITNNHLDDVLDDGLRLHVVDFCYNSGPARAIRWLQRVLRVPRTGQIDGPTRLALNEQDSWLVNEALVAARLNMIDRWTDQTTQAKAWEEGLESRGLRFSRIEVP